jgi:hypothetical protein
MLILGVDARGAHTATEYVEIPSLDEYASLIESYLLDEWKKHGKKFIERKDVVQ